MAITVSSINPKNAGSEKRVDCVVSFGVYSNTGNDNTTGELLVPAVVGMTGFSRVVVNQESGYQIEVLYSQSGPAVSYPTPIRFKVLQSVGGAGGNTSNTSGGTPSGTVSAPTFAGDALAGHAHNFAGNAMAGHAHTFAGNALAGHSHTFSGNALAGHSHTFSGNAMPAHSHALTQQDSSGIAVVADIATLAVAQSAIIAVYATVGGSTGPKTLIPFPVGAPAAGQCRWNLGNQIEFAAADAVTECRVTGLFQSTQSISAGTPAGTIDSVSAGTPAGTIDSVSAGTPAGTIDSVSAGTPAGTIDSVSAGTPSGTNSAPAFAGNALATHNHTYGGGGGGAVEVPNGTDLSASLGSVQIICYGV